jgi:hypothetical protein
MLARDDPRRGNISQAELLLRRWYNLGRRLRRALKPRRTH